MNRTRAVIVSVAVGLAAVAGVFALDRTLALGNASSTTTDQQVEQRTQQLNRYEASLRRTLAQKPPALPAIPRSVNISSADQAVTRTPAQSSPSVRVVYNRPPPEVVVEPRASDDDEHEDEETKTGPNTRRPRPMTDTSHRLYAVVIAVVVFFVSWATVAARPWAPAKSDPRLAAIAQREQRLRADAKLVQRVVDRRMAAYNMALKARERKIAAVKAQVAAAQARSLASSQASVGTAASAVPAVRVVNLPPLTITRTS